MRKTLAALLALVTLSGAAVAQERIRIAAAAQPGSVMEGIIKTFMDDFNAKAGGAYRMEYQFVGSDQELTQQVVRGRLEIGTTSLAGASVTVPEGGVLSMPYLWKTDAERRWVIDNVALPAIADLYRQRGLIVIGLGDTGWSNVFCKARCDNPAELAGRRFRLPPATAAKMFWDRLGVNGVQLSLPDFFTGLEQGMVEGGDLPFTFYVTTPAAQLARHYVLTQNYHHDQVFFINKRFFDGLPANIQALIRGAMPSATEMRRRQDADLKQRMDAFVAGGGTIVALTDEQRAAWSAKVVDGLAALVASLPGQSRALYDTVMEGKRRYAAQQ